MRKYVFVSFMVLALVALSIASAGADHPFVRGIVITVDYTDYYLAGPADAPNGAKDVPGHDWHQIAPNEIVGHHYNTGPFGKAQWWSSDAPDGELLFLVHSIIDTWSPEKAVFYFTRGYVHYHELVSVADGTPHPSKVVWLRHVAPISFTFDGGPMPKMGHPVSPGVDYEFMPNWNMPYTGEAHG